MKKLILSALMLMLLIPAGLFANTDNDPKTSPTEELCPPTPVKVVVTLGPVDCVALSDCQIEIVITNPNDCSQDTPPVAIKDYVYPGPTVFILDLPNAKLNVCARLKKGTTCSFPFYPKCSCIDNADGGTSLNVCVP